MSLLDPIEIPIALDTPLYVQKVILNEIEFTLRFDWHDRESRWYMDVGTSEGAWIMVGIKIVCNWPLLRRCSDSRRPAGVIMASDTSEGGEPPVFSELGRRVKLLYFPVAPVVIKETSVPLGVS